MNRYYDTKEVQKIQCRRYNDVKNLQKISLPSAGRRTISSLLTYALLSVSNYDVTARHICCVLRMVRFLHRCLSVTTMIRLATFALLRI